jgi:F0F1-type ATP synthase assembly protein I
MQQPNKTLRYAGLASQWIVMLLVAVWIGYKVVHWFHLNIGFIIVFPLISLAVSLWLLFKELNKPNE